MERFPFYCPAQGFDGPPVWNIKRGKYCAFCHKKNDVRLPCGHWFCRGCLNKVEDALEPEVRCLLCVYKQMHDRDAAWGRGSEYDNVYVNLTVQLQGLWAKQRAKAERVLQGQPLICTGCKERAAQVYQNQLDPENAVEIKDHICQYESKIPSLEEIATIKKKVARKKTMNAKEKGKSEDLTKGNKV